MQLEKRRWIPLCSQFRGAAHPAQISQEAGRQQGTPDLGKTSSLGPRCYFHAGWEQSGITRAEMKSQVQWSDTMGFPFAGTDVRTPAESEAMTEALSQSL